MRSARNLFVAVILTAAIVLLARHGAEALAPALPADMPHDAAFVQSGYNLQRNEPTGEWIACRPDPEQDADLCRITDNGGTVIFQGEFLPVSSSRPLPARELRVSSQRPAEKLWVRGPAEGSPVPVIPLADGQMLVPAADSLALATRWKQDPGELEALERP